MDVTKAIKERRAFRSLDPVEITEDLIKDLALHAQLAPSCNNNQPWRFVFVFDPAKLQEMRAALSQGNEWIRAASMLMGHCCKLLMPGQNVFSQVCRGCVAGRFFNIILSLS